jgi:hypothetical protein
VRFTGAAPDWVWVIYDLARRLHTVGIPASQSATAKGGGGVRVALAVAAAALLASSASVPTGQVAVAATLPNGADADWTLKLYMVEDTDHIAEDAIRNLNALAALPDYSNVHVVAMVDLPAQGSPDYPTDTLTGVGAFSDTRFVVLGNHRWNLVRDEGELEMGRPETLAGFIAEAAQLYPAHRYGVVLADHGSAYQGAYYDDGPPEPTSMRVADLRAGLLDGLHRAGIERFDLLAQADCLMASYEVVSALAPLSDVLIGSEELTGGPNQITTDAVDRLSENVTGEEWGRVNNRAYAADPGASGLAEYAALSVVDGGSAMTGLDAAVQSFSRVAVAHMAEIAPALARARAEALELSTDLVGPGMQFNAVDLGDLLEHLTEVPDDVAVARDSVFAALRRVVLDQVRGPAMQQATGLNVFFPGTNTRAAKQLDFYVSNHVGPPGWVELVQAYDRAVHSSGSGRASFVSHDAAIDLQGDDGLRISAELGEGQYANVVEAHTLVFTKVGGQDVLADTLPAYVNAGQVGRVQGVWDYGMLEIGSGGQRLPLTAAFQARQGGLLGDSLLRYRGPDGHEATVDLMPLLDSQGHVTVVLTFAVTGSSQTQITLQPGGTLTPYYTVVRNGNPVTELGARSLTLGDTWTVDYPQLHGGTGVTAAITLTDLSGAHDLATVHAEVPASRHR